MRDVDLWELQSTAHPTLMAEYVFPFLLCASRLEYFVLKWTWLLPLKSLHNEKIAWQLGWLKLERIKLIAYFSAEVLWASQHISFFLFSFCWSVSKPLRTACFLSPVVGFLHVVHTMHKYAACSEGLQRRSFLPCAGLSYIHGNQPVQS